MNTVKLLNISINNISQQELLKQIDRGGIVLTLNVDHLVKLQKDPDFYHAYNQADYRVCDSKILYFLSRFISSEIREKISGSDFFPAFYNYYKNDEKCTIFLLGASEGVGAEAQRRINKKVGRQMVVGNYSPSFGFERDEEECQKIIELINQSRATVLAVGLGAPKQEKWIYKYKEKLNTVKVFLAIGAAIDFEAGNRQRAPKWISEVGLEWLYRLLLEPRRLWRRYLVDSIPFFWWILQQKLNLYIYRKPIGLILREAGLLSNDRVEFILVQQAQNPKQRFGDLLVKQGWLPRETIDFFADRFPKIQKSRFKQPLGQYLKAAAILNQQQIDEILKEQERQKLRFGEISVRKGWVKQETIDFFLEAVTVNS